MLPRLHTTSRPGGTTTESLQAKYFQKLTECVENFVLYYCPVWDKKLHQKLKNAKNLIPAELCVAETIFSTIIFGQSIKKGFNAPHKDLNNMIFIFITLGTPTSGGHIINFDTKNNLYKSV